MIGSVLVVCVGNICRSPLGERILQDNLERLESPIKVTSAGLHAMVGWSADDETTKVAEAHGVSLSGHQARQFTAEIGRAHDLILVMEAGHKAEIVRMAPALSGKTFLFDQWTGKAGIADPYQRSREFHEAVFASIHDASQAWTQKLLATGARRA